jgi:cytochrome c-type biogenesis protein CcmH
MIFSALARSSRLLFAAFALTVVFLYGASAIAYAQTPDPSDQVYYIAKQLNCPTCAGRNLADCPTDTCMQWKQEIKSQLESGKSSQDVINYFTSRFGPTVLQEPPKEGVVLLLWVLPVIALAALAVGAVVVLRNITARGINLPILAQSGPTDKPVDEYVARLEDEVGKS